MSYPFVCLHCNRTTISHDPEDAEARLIQCECEEAAWRVKCNCTGLISDGKCVKCGQVR